MKGRSMSRLSRVPFSREAAVAAIAGVAAVAVSYALVGRTPTFVVSPVEGFLSRSMPGELVTFAITTVGSLGQQLNLLLATVLVAMAFAAVVRLSLLARAELGGGATLLSGVLVGLLAFLLSGQPVHTLLVAGAVVTIVGGSELATAFERRDPLSTKRRRALSAIGGAAGLAVVGYQAGRYEAPSATAEEAATLQGPNVDRTAIEGRLAEARQAEVDAEQVGSLVSDRFYNVDINGVDPEVDARSWELSITGAVEQEVTYTYDDIRERPAESRFAALRCVGEALNGHKMDAALWTGTPIKPLLEEASPQSGCGCVMLRGADGYFEEFPLEALEPGFLAYGMNGNVLPRSHGYPVRALVPGHWGEVNLKWLTEIEILEQEAEGYWEKRGWHGTGPVVPVAKLHTEADVPGGRLVGGHAYGGTRGVSAVEVSTDGGQSWNQAEVSDPLPDEDMWRQWAYTYEPPDGDHTVVVRMIDDDGNVQPEEERDTFPRGPSGWVTVNY